MTRINYIALFQESPLRTEKTLSLVELIRGGGLGGQIIIGLLFLLLLVAIYIFLTSVQNCFSCCLTTSYFIALFISSSLSHRHLGHRLQRGLAHPGVLV